MEPVPAQSTGETPMLLLGQYRACLLAEARRQAQSSIASRLVFSGGLPSNVGRKLFVQLYSEFVCEVLLGRSKIELVNQKKFPRAALF
jgi:hypothetical protein